MKRTSRLYHGGPAGLSVGDLIRPSISTGKQHGRSLHQPHYSPHKVYITTSQTYAQFFAKPDGVVYVVEPIGRIQLDTDVPRATGDSYSCAAAEIVAIHDPIPLIDDEITNAITRAERLRR